MFKVSGIIKMCKLDALLPLHAKYATGLVGFDHFTVAIGPE
jgi:hypothetical protein